jgi:hypothetical protein
MTVDAPPRAASGPAGETVTNGAAMAAYLAAGIGAFAMGLFVILNEAGIYAAPGLYAPAGGVSGRTTFAVVAWLLVWMLLHRRWSGRDVETRGILTATLALIVLGLVLCFPPVWGMFG